MCNSTPLQLLTSLNKNVMFQLSLSDKELFHSNFLKWLADTHEDFFKAVMRNLGVTLDSGFTAYREKNNFDLCLEDQNGQLLLVLENKVKSICGKKQIEDYNTKIKGEPKKVLLSLAEEFLDKDEIKALGWEVISYQKYSDELVNCLDIIGCDFDNQLIKKYADFIGTLSEDINNRLTERKEESLWIMDVPEDYYTIRIADLWQKLEFHKFAQMLKEKFDEKGIEDTINVGYTNNRALLEVSRNINDQFDFLIQIQNGEYRYAVAGTGKGGNFPPKIGNKLPKVPNDEWKIWFNNIRGIIPDVVKVFFSNREFKSYGANTSAPFYYQGSKIEKMSVKAVLEKIVDDITKLDTAMKAHKA